MIEVKEPDGLCGGASCEVISVSSFQIHETRDRLLVPDVSSTELKHSIFFMWTF